MATIFLSHSSADNSSAIAIGDWLAAEGWDDIFLDLDRQRGIKAGERWQDALKRASSSCELVLLLISPAWVASKWCLAEFLLAKQMNKRILAVTVAPTPLESIPIELSGEWQIVDLSAGSEFLSFEVVPDPGAAPTEVAFALEGLQRLKTGLLSSGLDPKFFAWPPENDPNRSPYRGLKSMQADDAGVFFGREGPVVEGLDVLRGMREAAPPRMLVILGASGAGKSSFMRAGLLPRLARDSRHFRPTPVIRPETAVLEGEEGLISAIEIARRRTDRSLSRAQIRDALEGDDKALAELFQPLVGSAVFEETGIEKSSGPTIILPIDQSEELFLADGVDEARPFLALLRNLLLLERPAVTAVFTIRSDSYEQLQTAPELVELSQQTFSLPPMPSGAHSEVILGPARRLSQASGQFEVEGDLVDALLVDIEESGAKDALPLLAFTLERLFREYGAQGRLNLRNYEETGRIRGAIEAAVAQALRGADDLPAVPHERPERLRLLRRAMIPALAGVDPETGTPRRRVARMVEIPTDARPLIDLLIDQRLLATDVSPVTGETTVEPAHEALLRQWGTLKGWLEEESEDLAISETLRRAARDWNANGCDIEWLVHAGGRLQLAEKVAAREDFARVLGPIEWAYLGACREAETAREIAAETARQQEITAQRQRRNILAAALSVSLVLLALAAWQWWEAGQQRTAAVDAQHIAEQRRTAALEAQDAAEAATLRAREAATPGLAALSTIATEAGDIVPAVKLALAAWPRDDADARARLPVIPRNLSSALPALIAGDWTHQRIGVSMRGELSVDGRYFALSNGQSVTLIDAHSGETVFQKKFDPYGEGFAFSDDGKWFAAIRQFPSAASVWRLDDLSEDPIKLATSDGPVSFGFSSDGAELAVAGRDGFVVINDLERQRQVRRIRASDSSLWDVALSPDRQYLAVLSNDAIRIVEAATEDVLHEERFDGTHGSVQWAGSDRLLVAGPRGVHLFSNDLTRLAGPSRSALVSRTSGVVAWVANNSIRLIESDLDKNWPIFNGRPGISLPDRDVRTLDWGRDDPGSLLIGDNQGSVWRLDVASGDLRSRYDAPGRQVVAAATTESGEVVVGYSDGWVQKFEPHADASVQWLTLPFSANARAVLSPDGVFIAGEHPHGYLDLREVGPDWPRRGGFAFEGAFAIAPGGDRIALLSNSNLTVVDPQGGRLVGPVQLSETSASWPNWLKFSPSGGLIAAGWSGRYYSAALLVDAATGETVFFRERSGFEHFDGIDLPSDDLVRFGDFTGWMERASDGSIVASDRPWGGASLPDNEPLTYWLDGMRAARPGGPGRNRIDLWDIATGVRILDMAGSGAQIRELSFAPVGDNIITLDDESSLGIWRIPDGLTGNAFQIACRFLPNVDLSETVGEYPIEIDVPICSDGYDPPLP